MVSHYSSIWGRAKTELFRRFWGPGLGPGLGFMGHFFCAGLGVEVKASFPDSS